jgi:hypothetical protein
MGRFSLAAVFHTQHAAILYLSNREYTKQLVLVRRMERYINRRNSARCGAVTLAPQHLDAKLLEEGELFEAAWAQEMSTLITLRRRNSPEAEAAARAARAATAILANRNDSRRDVGRTQRPGPDNAVAGLPRTALRMLSGSVV